MIKTIIASTIIILSIAGCETTTKHNSTHDNNKSDEMKAKDKIMYIRDGSTKIEFFNIKYKSIDKECLTRKIDALEEMIDRHDYDMQKHVPIWRETFDPSKEPWSRYSMILITSSDSDYRLIFLSKKNKKLSFRLLKKSPYLMKNQDSGFAEGRAKKEIDFMSCFR